MSNFLPDTQRYRLVVLRWGHLARFGVIWGCRNGAWLGISWGEARDAAGYPTTHRTVPTAKTSRGLVLGRAEGVTSWLTHTLLELGVQFPEPGGD